MRTPRSPRTAVVLGLTVFLTVGCGDDDPTEPPPTGSIEVSLAMSGSVPDADGVLITIGDGAGGVLHSGESLAVSGLAASTHTVTVTGVASNCTVEGEASRTVEVSANETTHVTFAVDCPAFGSLEIVTDGTAGAGATDPDGYTVTVDGDLSRQIGVRDVVAIPELAARQHQVELAGVADDCSAIDNPRLVTVQEGETTSVYFGVACPPFFDYIAFARYSGGLRYISVVKPDGSGLADLTGGSTTYRYGYPAWSPDAMRIAFTRRKCVDSMCESRDLFVMDLSDGAVSRMTQDAGAAVSTWSPDGGRIAYDSFTGEPQGDAWGDIYVVSADGTNPVNLTSSPGADFDPSWSPDGSRLAFARPQEEGYEVWLMNTDGSALEQITDMGEAYEPAWSPNGVRIAFVGPGEPCCGIWVMYADGSHPINLVEGYTWRPAWSPDGSRIAYYDPGVGIFVMNADGTGSVQIANGSYPAWSPGQ